MKRFEFVVNFLSKTRWKAVLIMEWWVASIVSDNYLLINIAKNTKTGKYDDDVRTCIGRYISFWDYQTPVSLLLNNDPVLSNTLILQTS